MPAIKRSSFRLSPDTIRQIEHIAKYQGGLTKTRVIEWAVERLYGDVMTPGKKSKKKPTDRLDAS